MIRAVEYSQVFDGDQVEVFFYDTNEIFFAFWIGTNRAFSLSHIDKTPTHRTHIDFFVQVFERMGKIVEIVLVGLQKKIRQLRGSFFSNSGKKTHDADQFFEAIWHKKELLGNITPEKEYVKKIFQVVAIGILS